MESLKNFFLFLGILFFFFIILQWGYEMTRRSCFHAQEQTGACNKTFICQMQNQSDAPAACQPRFARGVFENSPITNWFSRSDGTAVIIESAAP